ncbi:MAG: NAD(P)H-binding protein [Bacteroidales bacterium]|nr:NAD(P)H-binding protein [Bacteroidales bacterium]
MKTALVIGATGLVGFQLVKQLIEDKDFVKVVVFSRRATGLSSPKLEEHIVDFDRPEQWQHLVKGDVLFSALGTTLAKAGGKKAQYQVDHSYQYQFAAAAARNAVPVYVLVSSAGANPKSSTFYMRMKGELERDVKELLFSTILLIKPGPLHGERKERRLGENLGVALIRFFNTLGLFRKYRPIGGDVVARAMIQSFKRATPGVAAFELDELFLLAKDQS